MRCLTDTLKNKIELWEYCGVPSQSLIQNRYAFTFFKTTINPLKPELNPICYLLAW